MTIGSQALVITLEYAPFEIPTPPFSITPAEIDDYYREHYAIAHIERPTLPEHPMVRKMGLDFLIEHGFFLTKLRDDAPITPSHRETFQTATSPLLQLSR
jgi:thiopurine S-methyltransferase